MGSESEPYDDFDSALQYHAESQSLNEPVAACVVVDFSYLSTCECPATKEEFQGEIEEMLADVNELAARIYSFDMDDGDNLNPHNVFHAMYIGKAALTGVQSFQRDKPDTWRIPRLSGYVSTTKKKATHSGTARLLLVVLKAFFDDELSEELKVFEAGHEDLALLYEKALSKRAKPDNKAIGGGKAQQNPEIKGSVIYVAFVLGKDFGKPLLNLLDDSDTG